MTQRIMTRIGDVFCAGLEGKGKRYFQYIAKDLYQLNSSVIRVFQTTYPTDASPTIPEIVRDRVSFYAHTVLRVGVLAGAWEKVGASKDINQEALKEILFGCTHALNHIEREGGGYDIVEVNPLENWYVWHIGEEHVGVGALPKEYAATIELGSVFPYSAIIERMQRGYYPGIIREYEGLEKGVPR